MRATSFSSSGWLSNVGTLPLSRVKDGTVVDRSKTRPYLLVSVRDIRVVPQSNWLLHNDVRALT